MKFLERIKRWFMPYSQKVGVNMTVVTEELPIVGKERAMRFVEEILIDKLKAVEDMRFVSENNHYLLLKAERFNIDAFKYWINKNVERLYEPHWSGFREIKLNLDISVYDDRKRTNKFSIILVKAKGEYDWKVLYCNWVKPIPVK